jgi:uncharacterized protein (TIGR03435 family)
MLAHLPKWVETDYFEIQARAAGNPTKDQIRLMMQSLLAERFKLAVHFETRQVRVLALNLVTHGTTGPKLIPHAGGPPCNPATSMPPQGLSPNDANVSPFPPVCDYLALGAKPSKPFNTMLAGSRNATMALLAASLPSLGGLTQPVVDQTGLSGNFDFTIEWMPVSDNPALFPATSFLNALKDQLGLKLVPATVPLDVLVIDHVERPSGELSVLAARR